jgi:hypothetical protein
MIIADHLATAEREHLAINFGGGNDAFKRHRGAEPHCEHDVVFDRHVPVHRRAPWWLMQHVRAWRHGPSLDLWAAEPPARRPGSG